MIYKHALGEIASWRAYITEAISLANELNDMPGLAVNGAKIRRI